MARNSKSPAAKEPKLLLGEYLDREDRLRRRPEMKLAFARHCSREGIRIATAAEFQAALSRFEGKPARGTH